MVLKGHPRGSLQQPQFGRDGAGRVEMSDSRAGRALSRGPKSASYSTKVSAVPPPLINLILVTPAGRRLPSRVSIPFLSGQCPFYA